MKTLYRVGIYCRLSVDDANNSAKAKNYIPADESVSIENQRELLSKFVMLNGWIEAKTYIDDGYSGGNFQRPGFLEMLEDARNGVINLILVKDLSRLGRDFVEVGRYTDVVFPSLGVRFVSVLDCLDSDGDNTDMLHFRSLMNDYHLRDLSSKIKSVLHSKKAAGQFLSAYTPYGYRKSDEDKHRLVIDEYAAGVVRRIYEMRQSGIAYGKIAATLNQEGVLSPRVYWYQQSGKAECKAAQLWAYATVKVILHNEVYIGNLIMNHSGHRSYKDKSTIRKPESEWIRVEDAHEAIVSRDLWEAVQEINETAKHRVDGNRAPGEKLFSGKLICAGCGSTLAASTGTKHAGAKTRNGHYLTDKHYVTYQCGVHIRSGRSVCSPHSVSEITLSRIIAAEIRVQAQAVKTGESAAVERLKQSVAQQDEQYLADIRQEVTQLQRRLRELKNTNVKLYEDKIGGKISESAFSVLIQKSEQERLDKAQRLDALLSVIQEVEQKTAAIKDWTALIRKYMNVQVLDRETIDELIDHIEIGERTVTDGKRHQEIKVFYRFVGQIK